MPYNQEKTAGACVGIVFVSRSPRRRRLRHAISIEFVGRGPRALTIYVAESLSGKLGSVTSSIALNNGTPQA